MAASYSLGNDWESTLNSYDAPSYSSGYSGGGSSSNYYGVSPYQAPPSMADSHLSMHGSSLYPARTSAPASTVSTMPQQYQSNFEREMARNHRTPTSSSAGQNGNLSASYINDLRSVLGGLQKVKAPTYTQPDYKAPEFDQSRVDFYTQQAAAPGTSALRQGLRAGMQRAGTMSDNPNVVGAIENQALSGYGQGLSSVYGQAQGAGLQRYTASEYQPAVDAAKTEYMGDVTEAQTQYNQGLSNYQTAQNLYYQLLPQIFGESGGTGNGWGQTYIGMPGGTYQSVATPTGGGSLRNNRSGLSRYNISTPFMS